MSFTRPTLSEIVSRVQVDFVSRLNLIGAVLRRSMVYVLSRVIAGASHMLHGHLDWLSRQLFPDTSEEEALVRQAAVFGLTKTAPTFATGTVDLTGTNTTVCPAGTVLVRSDGAEYVVDADETITLGVATVDVTASLAGADYTLEAGVVLSFQSPISGIDSSGEVAASTVDGTDEETTEALRVRFLARLAEPPMGGSSADYVAWSKEVAGVTRVWVEELGLGPGTVVVRFVRDNDGSIIPDAGEVTALQTYLDTKRPAHATVTAHAPTANAVAYTIAVVPDTTAVRAAVTAQLDDLHLREGEPGVTLLLSAIRTAIGNATGLTDYTLTVPAANVTNTANQIPTRGTITWV